MSKFLFFIFYFYLYIYPPDSQESDGGAIRGAFNKFPDFFCTGIYNCRKLEIFQYVVTILLMR